MTDTKTNNEEANEKKVFYAAFSANDAGYVERNAQIFEYDDFSEMVEALMQRVGPASDYISSPAEGVEYFVKFSVEPGEWGDCWIKTNNRDDLTCPYVIGPFEPDQVSVNDDNPGTDRYWITPIDDVWVLKITTSETV